MKKYGLLLAFSLLGSTVECQEISLEVMHVVEKRSFELDLSECESAYSSHEMTGECSVRKWDFKGKVVYVPPKATFSAGRYGVSIEINRTGYIVSVWKKSGGYPDDLDWHDVKGPIEFALKTYGRDSILIE